MRKSTSVRNRQKAVAAVGCGSEGAEKTHRSQT